MSRSGWNLRSSRAMARSRCTWPRPIGLEMKSARRLRLIARTQVPPRGLPPTKSRTARLNITGSRAGCRCPPPLDRHALVGVAVDHERRALHALRQLADVALQPAVPAPVDQLAARGPAV